MSPLIIALIGGISYLVQITIFFNIFAINERAKFMIMLWLLNLPLIIACCLVMNKYQIITNDYLMGGFEVNILLTVFFYMAGFFGGVLQLYNLADRGFSLRILIDMLESNQADITVDRIMKEYSQGKGVLWMYQKRLDDLQANGLISISNGVVENTVKGKRLSRVFGTLREIVNLR